MTHRLITLALAALVTVSFAACGAGIVGSCDFRDGSVNGAEPRCQEWSSSPTFGLPDTYKLACDSAKGKYATTGCPRTSIVAGCQLTAGDGSKVYNWYYAPKTVDQVTTECQSDKGTFTAAP